MKPRSLVSLTTIVLATACSLPSARAANDAWSTAPGGNTFTGNNWTTGTNTPGAATGTLASGDSLFFGNSSTTTLNEDEAAGFSIAGFTFNTGASAFNITGNSFALSGGITNNSTNLQSIGDAFTMAATNTFTSTSGGGNLTLGGAISGTGGGIIATGTGTTTLGGTLSYTGGTTIGGGALTLTGTGGLNALALGNTGTTGTLNIASSGTVATTGDFQEGTGATAGVGVVNHSAGTFNIGGGTGQLQLGYQAGSYGAYNLSGGTVNVGAVRNGGFGNGNGNTLFNQTGGIFNSAGISVTGRGGSGTNIFFLSGVGSQYNVNGNNDFHLSFSANSYSVGTVAGGTLSVTGSVKLGEGGTGANTATTAILNLNGGVLSTNSVYNGAGTVAVGTRIVNFNGGTLQAKAANGAFLTGVTSANIYSGGATIDSGNFAVTIPQNLLSASATGAAGTGIDSLPVTGGGSGYLAAPVVKITGGGGTGATAVAVLTSGVVTGIQITSNGTGYTSAPTFTLVGGGAVTAATPGTATISSNAADGGLTKIGAGTLNLSGASNYTGATRVNAGVLATNTLAANGSASGIGAGTAVTLDGGTLRYTGGTNVTGTGFNRNISVSSGGGTLDNSNAGFVTYSGTISGSGALTFLDGNTTPAARQFLVTSGSSGFSGNVFVGTAAANSGVLQYRSNNANPFGTGTVQVNAGGVLTADGGATTPSTLGNNIVLNGGKLGTQTPNMSYTGTVLLQASSTVGHPFTGTVGTVDLSGVISGGSGAALNISTATSVTISNNSNTYTGATNVNGGTLVVNGNISTSVLTTVNTGGTLMGNGTSGDLTVATGGTFAPGNSIGTFNVTGNLTLGGTAGFEINPSGNLADLAIASAIINFGGTLNVSNIGGVLANGDSFNLFDWSGTSTGSFATVNLPSLDPSLSWDTGNLYTNGTIAVIPEPNVAAATGVFGMLALLRRRRK